MQNLIEFNSGADYDAQEDPFDNAYEPEIKYLTSLALKQQGAILDVCCGTGIVTIPLADTGLEVVGIDISAGMLAHAEAKAGSRENLSFRLQNALAFKLAKRFDLAIMTGNAFQAFMDESEISSLLENINEHLNTGGLLVFDTRLPEGYDFTLQADFQPWGEYTDSAGRFVRALGKQTKFDAERNLLYFEDKLQYPDGTEVFSRFGLKFTPLESLLTLARGAGFEVVNQYKNWRLDAFEQGGANIVLELKKL